MFRLAGNEPPRCMLATASSRVLLELVLVSLKRRVVVILTVLSIVGKSLCTHVFCVMK